MSELTRVPRELLAYTIWADRQILECLAGVPDEDLHRETGTSFGTILRTMAHILAAEQIWLARFLARRSTPRRPRATTPTCRAWPPPSPTSGRSSRSSSLR